MEIGPGPKVQRAAILEVFGPESLPLPIIEVETSYKFRSDIQTFSWFQSVWIWDSALGLTSI